MVGPWQGQIPCSNQSALSKAEHEALAPSSDNVHLNQITSRNKIYFKIFYYFII